MTGEARYAWTHGIPSRAHNDDAEADGQACMRTRRVSLTWRAVLGAPCSCAFPAHCDSRAGWVGECDGDSAAQTTFI